MEWGQGYSLDALNAQKMKFSIKVFFGKCDQIRSFLRIWSHLHKKCLMKNFIFCAVIVIWRCDGGDKPLLGGASLLVQ